MHSDHMSLEPADWIALAAAALSTVIATFSVIKSFRDGKLSSKRLDRIEFEDHAHVKFGQSWGGLSTTSMKRAGFDSAAYVPFENTGKRAGGISYAKWNVTDAQGNILAAGGDAFLSPKAEWPGLGDTTVPAGSRRLFALPLSKRAAVAISAEEEELRLYVRIVGKDEDIRAALLDSGVTPRPWTPAEISDSDRYEAWMVEQAIASDEVRKQFGRQ